MLRKGNLFLVKSRQQNKTFYVPRINKKLNNPLGFNS